MPRLAHGFVFGAGLPGLTGFEFNLDSGPEPQRAPPPSRKRLVEEPLRWSKPPNRTEAEVPVLKAVP